MAEIPDLRGFLESWPYDAGHRVRRAHAADGREIIFVREPMGLQQYEMNGRPDGQRPHGLESLLAFHESRHATALARAGGLSAEDCALLIHEGLAYHDRTHLLVRLRDWPRVERDTARNLRLIAFLRRHARCAEDRADFDPWHPELTRLHAVARALLLLEKGDARAARKIATSVGITAAVADPSPGHLTDALLASVRDCFLDTPAPPGSDEPVFRKQDDYWLIAYHGQQAHLKCTRGLQCLAFLLRYPGREFYVSELLAHPTETPAPPVTALAHGSRHGSVAEVVMVAMHSGTPLLDPQAKAQYQHRLTELREDLREAEHRHDPSRAALAQEELDAITRHLASAIGLGGRDRPTSSAAERARCAVTKRLKQAIQKIAEANPSLGHHLAARIKTGYFCSYAPHPDRPVAWTF